MTEHGKTGYSFLTTELSGTLLVLTSVCHHFQSHDDIRCIHFLKSSGKHFPEPHSDFFYNDQKYQTPINVYLKVWCLKVTLPTHVLHEVFPVKLAHMLLLVQLACTYCPLSTKSKTIIFCHELSRNEITYFLIVGIYDL